MALLWRQNSSPSAPAKPQKADSNSASDKSSTRNSNLAPPRSDSVNAASLGDDAGNSSSKDTQIDLSPPPDDTKEHPKSSDMLTDEGSAGGGDTTEFHPWDPHKAAKDVEVGDYYFKRKNYAGAESRYREALFYKDNDAVATYRLAVCLEKMDRPDEALSRVRRLSEDSSLRPRSHGSKEGHRAAKESGRQRETKL